MKARIHLEAGRPQETIVEIDGLRLEKHVDAASFRIDLGGEAAAAIKDPTYPVRIHMGVYVDELDLTGDLLAAITPVSAALVPPERIEQACEVMHDAYEAAAVGAGWETQQQSRKPWADVPEANKVTMRAAVAALLDWNRGGQ